MSTRWSNPRPSSLAEITPSAPARDVFFDPTGRRWRLIKGSTILMLALVALAVSVSWGPMHQPPTLKSKSQPLRPPPVDLQDHAPLIGVGPLVRLVRVAQRAGSLFAVDPLNGHTLGQITGDDADTVGNASFAMQRYGYSSVAHKTLELTFDDGPDPTWTPQILDLLSHYKVPATFFVIGAEAAKFPAIVAREVREGHAIGNHSLTHPDLQPNQVEHQFVANDHILRATTGVATNLIRLPYDGAAGKAADRDLNTVMYEARELRYVVSMEEFDTDDWMYGDPRLRPKTPIPLPPATADNLTILLHDGGGNRSTTIAYLRQLIPWALAHCYIFHSLPQVSPQVVAGTSHISPTLWDREDLWMYQAMWAWPNIVIRLLFVLAMIFVVFGSGVNLALAVGRRLRHRQRFAGIPTRGGATGPPVSVVVAAYNEEKVIAQTLDALCRSRYTNLREIIVVDDGSSDATAQVVTKMSVVRPRIRLLRQRNAGKATALNRGFVQARSPIVVTLDADTQFTPTTISQLARHFARDKTRRLAAVAGVVKLGNHSNLLTRWQALEYIMQIGVDRGAQDALHAILVVPGACAAWRRSAVLRVGGYSRATLAEDCDLALQLQQEGYLVSQDDEAVGYTEAPDTVRALARQRFRWMYGTLQPLWKHRRMMLNPRYSWLGMLMLPLGALSVLLPAVFLPFVYAMAVILVRGQGWGALFIYVVLFLLAQLLTAIVGIWLIRERPAHLLMVPLYRVINEPLRAYILYKSLLAVLRGRRSSWNKLQRKGTVSIAAPKLIRGAA